MAAGNLPVMLRTIQPAETRSRPGNFVIPTAAKRSGGTSLGQPRVHRLGTNATVLPVHNIPPERSFLLHPP